MTNIAEPTPEMIEAVAKAIDADAWEAQTDGRDIPGTFWHIRRDIARNRAEAAITAMRSSAPQEPDALRRLVEESLYHLRLDDRAKDYHERALAALEGKTLASKGRCHCGFWPCPTHQIDDISERPAEAQEPVADDDALIARLRSLMKRAEPLPWVWEQCGEKEDCPVIGVASDVDDKVLSGELPDHGDEIMRFNIASDWGSGVEGSAPSANAQFVVEVVNALPLLLDRLQAKAPETGEPQ